MEHWWLCVVYRRIIYRMLELSKVYLWWEHHNEKNKNKFVEWKRLLIPWEFRVLFWWMNFCTRFLRLLVLPWLRERLQIAIFCLGWMARLKWRASGYDASWQHPRTLYLSNLVLTWTGHDQCFPGQPALGLSFRSPVALLWNTLFQTQQIPFVRLVCWSISFRWAVLWSCCWLFTIYPLRAGSQTKTGRLDKEAKNSSVGSTWVWFQNKIQTITWWGS